MGYEPTTLVFERVKAFQAVDPSATVIRAKENAGAIYLHPSFVFVFKRLQCPVSV
jgi:hypothetical protein